jgi:hypothetical protein
MKKLLPFFIFSLCVFFANAQTTLENNLETIQQKNTELTASFEYFFTDCLVNKDCNDCIKELVAKAKDGYQSYLVGGALYQIAPEASYRLHKKAIESKPNELSFNLEYALESHRAGEYATAIKYYERYKKAVPKDYRANVWLSECYLNLDNYSKAIEHWKAANHPKNHVGIDKAIHIIHGDTDQIQKRSAFLKKIQNKDAKSAYKLIFLDMNWKLDWWNSNIQEYFLNKDMLTIKEAFGLESKVYKELDAYKTIKQLSKQASMKDSIQKTFLNAKLLLNNNKIPNHGKVASDLLQIAFFNDLIVAKQFFEDRGDELLKLADTHQDIELLNIYAYLEATVNGKVAPATDKKGWDEYKSEKFAISYFIGLADKNTYDNPDLAKALQDFPNSSKIHWVKLNCAKIEGKPLKDDLIAVLKKEFKTLGSDPSKYSYGLKSYFALLEEVL